MMECRTRFEFTPLIFAAEHGHLEVLKLLFVRGAKIDAVTYNGSRAIHKAAQNNRPDIVKFLVQEAGELVDIVSTFFCNLYIIRYLLFNKKTRVSQNQGNYIQELTSELRRLT